VAKTLLFEALLMVMLIVVHTWKSALAADGEDIGDVVETTLPDLL
jgi:hypothetical protein